MRILAIVFGAVLLLPGACALLFAAGASTADWRDLGALWGACFAVSLAGALLIVFAIRKRGAP